MSLNVTSENRKGASRGQAAVEVVILIPLAMTLLFGIYQIGRIFFLYQTLQKAVRGGAGLIAKTSNVNFCDPGDPAITDAGNFIVYGNLEGVGAPIIQGLTPDLIQISGERILDTTTVTSCLCTQDPDSCDPTQGGRPPDFVVVNLGPGGFPLVIQFPYFPLPAIPLKPSVRMAVTGG